LLSGKIKALASVSFMLVIRGRVDEVGSIRATELRCNRI
jgi:hypothetical protein